MALFDSIAEERIAQAMQRGDFDALPGAGRPLELDDDRLVPEEVRVAYRVLKNAGFVPPEVEARREIADLRRAVEGEPDDTARARGLARLQLLRLRLAGMRGSPAALEPYYATKLVRRLGTGG